MPKSPVIMAPQSGFTLPRWVLGVNRYRGLLVPLAFMSLLVVILVPLPPWLMDILISANISLAVIVLLTTIHMQEPLDFSVFPSLLLGTTLFRLVLNVASTRLILSADASTPQEAMGVAGDVISAFGNFVAGDSLAVGIVIFVLLIIVQFVVITKGATRISEVAARFTLDAMPGKQMAIDADLNAGLIKEDEARRRRERISQEADFFGAMDGASKFVRGDAVAGLLITALNVAGGFAVGVLQRGWPAGQAAEVFTKLTIGDGLTSQIPAFVVSIAAALIVTRSGSKADLGTELTGQVLSQPTGLYMTAGFLGLLSLTPLPTIPLLATAALLAAIAYGTTRSRRAAAAESANAINPASGRPEPPPPEQLLKVDTLELEVGYGLVSLVDSNQGGDLLDRISSIRRQLAAEMGFILPPVRIRDNMRLPANEYRVKIRGSPVGKGQTVPGRLLAMDSGIASGPIDGIPTKEPAFGLDAWWIDPSLKNRAETMNYTVVDPSSVLATHITELVKLHADELLTREEVNNLTTQLAERCPKLVKETVPEVVKPADLQKILQNLLRERVPVRDLETILETIADWGAKTKDLDVLTEYVRNALRRTICLQYASAVDDRPGAAPGKGAGPMLFRLVCVTLDPALEDRINGYIERTTAGTAVTMPASVANQIAGQILRALQQVAAAGHHPVVLSSPQVRGVVRQLIAPQVPTVAVLSYNEIVPGVEVESLALVGSPDAEAAVAAA
ncbi:MAG: flagellar biosynthesis protein FlhA [Phycisphaeraceae bacterium]|nr:flagellar biosynthesis protein FlhA [Phycisphaeraceae bacterium]